MTEEKKETKEVEEVKEQAPEQPRLRQIILETDGNMVQVTKNETAGNLELVSALQAVLALISKGR